jgi:hypothetical protein
MQGAVFLKLLDIEGAKLHIVISASPFWIVRINMAFKLVCTVETKRRNSISDLMADANPNAFHRTQLVCGYFLLLLHVYS